jgi:hypothetical protein
MAERAENQALSESLSSKSGMMFDDCSWFGVWRTIGHYIFITRSVGAKVGVSPSPLTWAFGPRPSALPSDGAQSKSPSSNAGKWLLPENESTMAG